LEGTLLAVIKRNKFLAGFFALIIAFFALSKVVNFNEFKSLLSKEFNNNALSINVNGDINFELFPLPHLEFNNVVIKYDDTILINADKINKGGLNPFSTSISNLEIESGIFDLTLLEQYISTQKTQGMALLKNLSFKEVEMKLSRTNKLDNAHGKLYSSSSRLNLQPVSYTHLTLPTKP
jgi:hypothetical protein